MYLQDNAPETTLSVGLVDALDQSCSLADNTGQPNPSNREWPLIVWDPADADDYECVMVEANAAGALTLSQRGAFGTTAKAWPAASKARHAMPMKALLALSGEGVDPVPSATMFQPLFQAAPNSLNDSPLWDIMFRDFTLKRRAKLAAMMARQSVAASSGALTFFLLQRVATGLKVVVKSPAVTKSTVEASNLVATIDEWLDPGLYYYAYADSAPGTNMKCLNGTQFHPGHGGFTASGWDGSGRPGLRVTDTSLTTASPVGTVVPWASLGAGNGGSLLAVLGRFDEVN